MVDFTVTKSTSSRLLVNILYTDDYLLKLIQQYVFELLMPLTDIHTLKVCSHVTKFSPWPIFGPLLCSIVSVNNGQNG